ncbi:nucleotidyltransferase domain-containing protein [Paenibacillus mendelii]|uniref:Nucleotidyltransferase domain-containing protein n=1 Tax=Paenibacillus mendelii TaxID=206163 RepID=A0ABV6J588_9BACL|nr:hypothetical protein [Paenibacillus mendelii]MCQ6561824.1 hypothetical protein [Paenibacillus mendelii]
MRTDIYNWMPISVSEVCAIFSEMPVKWCIAGGWALDLHVGQQSRPHADVDVILLRGEQLTAYQHLTPEWKLYKAEDGKLSDWEEGEFLATTQDIWVSKDSNSPWAFQIMFIDTEQDYWIYRREKAIRRPLQDCIATTTEGIPYLKPEIQLLYKGGSSGIRDKDQTDFLTVLPTLRPPAREWLKVSLKRQFPEGHAWVEYIDKHEDPKRG